VATKLVGGPIVLRIHGATRQFPLRYALIFRLNRPAPRFPNDPKDPAAGPILPDGARIALGNYTIEGFTFDAYTSIFDDDPVLATDRDNCFMGNLSTENRDISDPDIFHRLDKIPNRGIVHVSLHPLTYRPDGSPTFARRYVRTARMIPTRVRSDTRLRYDYGNTLLITSPAALKALKRIGCYATDLY
jgi:hypothetical protein